MSSLLAACAVLWEARVALALAMGAGAWVVLGITLRRPVASVLALLGPVLMAVYLPAVLAYLAGLSTDSLAELNAPDWNEVLFYLGTLRGLIQPLQGAALVLAAGLMAGAFTVSGVARLSWRQRPEVLRRVRWTLGLAVLALAVVHTFQLGAYYLESGREIASIRQNFQGAIPTTTGTLRPLHVVVYIGESTSVANMQLYGYPRGTTPRLSERQARDPGLLRFDDVVSTHTHTSPSLMDALSFKRVGSLKPIYERPYVSLVSVLNRRGVPTALISNQGQHGTWNIGGAVVFADIGSSFFSVNSRALGNSELRAPRPFDHDVFEQQLARMWHPLGAQVLFLHSYAGHGPYLSNIPLAYRGWSDELERISASGWVGDRLVNPAVTKQAVLDYDRAVRYIDATVDQVMSWTDARPEPTVTIYFSDHGESAWTGRGHDSSKVLLDMLRVPLILAFNSTARAAYPELFERFRAASERRQTRTLDTIAPTVTELLGLEVEGNRIPSLTDTRQPGSAVVLQRRLKEGLGGVVIDDAGAPSGALDLGDPASRMFRDSRHRPATAPMLCHHRANALGRARRAALSSGCMEFDVAPGAKGIEVLHPPKEATGFLLKDLLGFATGARMSLWIDTKDLPSEQCMALTRQLRPVMDRLGSVLIELPPDLSTGDERLKACAADWRALGVSVSYYVPTDQAIRCATELVQHASREQAATCRALAKRVAEVRDTGWITDLSLDAAGAAAIAAMPEAISLRVNLWGLSTERAARVDDRSYRFLLIDSSADPNGY